MIQNIFLLDGLGGTGKSDFIKYINKKYVSDKRGVVIQKITTREQRPEEKDKKPQLDLKFVKPSTFDEHTRKNDLYVYIFGGYGYGFHKSDTSKTR